jgi:hypothetical protein
VFDTQPLVLGTREVQKPEGLSLFIPMSIFDFWVFAHRETRPHAGATIDLIHPKTFSFKLCPRCIWREVRNSLSVKTASSDY